jgi:hypothetical protein
LQQACGPGVTEVLVAAFVSRLATGAR